MSESCELHIHSIFRPCANGLYIADYLASQRREVVPMPVDIGELTPYEPREERHVLAERPARPALDPEAR